VKFVARNYEVLIYGPGQDDGDFEISDDLFLDLENAYRAVAAAERRVEIEGLALNAAARKRQERRNA